jgi:hypothetical protein
MSIGPENDCAGEGQQLFQTTDPSSHQRERSTSTNMQLSYSNKNLFLSPRRVLYSKTDWPTNRRSQYKSQTLFEDDVLILRENHNVIAGKMAETRQMCAYAFRIP